MKAGSVKLGTTNSETIFSVRKNNFQRIVYRLGWRWCCYSMRTGWYWSVFFVDRFVENSRPKWFVVRFDWMKKWKFLLSGNVKLSVVDTISARLNLTGKRVQIDEEVEHFHRETKIHNGAVQVQGWFYLLMKKASNETDFQVTLPMKTRTLLSLLTLWMAQSNSMFVIGFPL